MTQSVGIIGGGTTGLEVARRLVAAGLEVTLMEGRDEVGGQARSFPFYGQQADRFGHTVLPTDEGTLRLLQELGLLDSVLWTQPTHGYFAQGRLFSFSGRRDLFLQHRELPLRAKLRIALSQARFSRLPNWERLDRVTASDWLRVRMGDFTLQLIWKPWLEKIFGSCWREVSALQLWGAHLRGSPGAGWLRAAPGCGCLVGGVGSLARRQMQSIEADGGDIRRDFQVMGVTPITRGKGFLVSGQSGETFRFDQVVAAIPVPRMARLMDGFPESWTSAFRGIRYRSAVSVALSVNRPLSGYHWVNVCDPAIPFYQVIEIDKVPGVERPAGLKLAHLHAMVGEEDPLWQESDDAIGEEFATRLGLIFPGIYPDHILDRWVFRESEVLPMHPPGLKARLVAGPTPLSGFHLADPGLVYPRGSNLNQAILEAGRVVAAILREQL